MPATGRTVYFLGAGATRADFPEAPLMEGLLDAILRSEPRDEILRRFLSDAFDAQPLEPNSDPELRPRIDDVFSLIDSSLFRETTLFLPLWPLDELVLARRHLIACMARVIDAAIHEPFGATALRFTDALPRHQSTVISTNYDICMDNALLASGNVNYGVAYRSVVARFDTVPDGRPDEARHFRPLPAGQAHIRKDGMRLLKLHGSLNWLYCPRCEELDISLDDTGRRFVLDTEEFGRCSTGTCTAHYEALVIGPSPEQRYGHRVLQTTWKQADLALRSADRLVVIGYSLPESDYLIRSLLARRFAKRSDCVLVVSLRSMEQETADSRLEARYRRLFPRCRFRWDGFEAYAGDLFVE